MVISIVLDNIAHFIRRKTQVISLNGLVNFFFYNLYLSHDVCYISACKCNVKWEMVEVELKLQQTD